MRRSFVVTALAVALASSTAHAEPAAPAAASSFFEDSTWGAGLHYAHWEGAYASQGVGGRLRWEPFEYFGVDLTSEFLGNDGGFDIPVGFQLFVPVALGGGVRVRALAGLCTMMSLSKSASVEASAGDDIRFGFRFGGGAEMALGDRLWLFADAEWERYLGHSRKVSAWSSALDGDLGVTDRLALAIGLGIHL